MASGERIRVVLDLEASGLIRGSVATPGSDRRQFYGWLELATALEHARSGGSPDCAKAVAPPGMWPPLAD